MSEENTECIYCGSIGNMTRDHIPPKCLFPHPRPSNLITVPCCEDCRSSQSEDDEYFRTIIATSGGSEEHPAAAELWTNEIIRSLEKPTKEGFRELIRTNMKPVDVVSEGGIFLGKSIAFDYDIERINSVLDRTTQGLFFTLRGYRLSQEFYIKISIHPNLSLVPDYIVQLIDSLDWQDIGEGIFKYKCRFFDEEPNGSLWFLSFYDSWPVICLTAPR